jgi:hypothetical protein
MLFPGHSVTPGRALTTGLPDPSAGASLTAALRAPYGRVSSVRALRSDSQAIADSSFDTFDPDRPSEGRGNQVGPTDVEPLTLWSTDNDLYEDGCRGGGCDDGHRQ